METQTTTTQSLAPKEEVPEHIAVYGTLRKDVGKQYVLLQQEEATEPVCIGKIKGQLIGLGGFPGLIDTPLVKKQGLTVYVEVHRILEGKAKGLLHNLDRYEGYRPRDINSSLFIRKKVKLLEPKDLLVWVYYYAIVPASDRYWPIKDGDWLMYMTGKPTKPWKEKG